MDATGLDGKAQTRRKLLGSMAAAGAVLGLAAARAEAGVAAASGTAGEAVPEELVAMARLRNYKTRRSSSWDRTGGNNDSVPVEPGQTTTLLDVTGAGVVTHLWFTIATEDKYHLKNLVLRACGMENRRRRWRRRLVTFSGWDWGSIFLINQHCWRWLRSRR